MLTVDQFVYTTASLSGKSGYQIIAKSSGVSEEIISELDDYLYPTGIEPSEFNEARSMLLLKNGRVAFSKIKNIGMGYDGRNNTLYNHTLIVDKEDFAKYEYDTRIFEQFYVENTSLQGKLPVLQIDPIVPEMDFQIAKNSETIVKETLTGLFRKQKIAILDAKDTDLIQKILSMLPPSMRLISFSTLVIQPEKQPNYHLIQTKSQNKSILEKNFKIVNPEEPSDIQKQTALEKSISYLKNLINSQKKDDLQELHDSFEKLPGTDFKSKIILLATFSQYQAEQDENLKQKYAEEILSVLKKFDKLVASDYLDKIKSSLREYAILTEKLQPVINPYTSLIDAFFLLPTKVMSEFYRTYVKHHEKSENEED